MNKKIIWILLLVSPLTMAAPSVNPKITAHFDASRIGQENTPEDLTMPITPEPVVLNVPEGTAKKIDSKADEQTFRLNKVLISGSTVYKLEDLKKTYAQYLDKKVTLDDLYTIANAITAKYRHDGYFLSRAIIPEQNIIDGQVTIKILEGFVANILIEGKTTEAVHQKLLSYGEKIKAVRPLTSKVLERYVLLANELSGVQVKTVLSPAKNKIGAIELTFVVKQKLVGIAVDFNNYGSKYFGYYQAGINLQGNSIFWGADQLGIYALTSPFANNVLYGQLYYSRALGSSGLKLDIEGDAAQTKPGDIVSPLNLIGTSKGFSAKLVYPVMRSRKQDFSLHTTFRWLNNYGDVFEDQSYFTDHIRSLRFGGDYSFVDRWYGSNLIKAEASCGLKIMGASQPGGINLSEPGADPQYNKVNIYASRLQLLPKNFSILLAAAGQYGFQPLLSSEEFDFGGRDFGRGYDLAEMTGDSGIAGKIELRFNQAASNKYIKGIEYFVFYDVGMVWDRTDSFNFGENEHGMTCGIGLSINLFDHFKASLEVDKPLFYPEQWALYSKNGKIPRVLFSVMSAF
jgi:hemolysin activation/secretion protein